MPVGADPRHRTALPPRTGVRGRELRPRLVPRRGITVAVQRRDRTGLRFGLSCHPAASPGEQDYTTGGRDCRRCGTFSPVRVVSLLPTATEIVYSLGLQDSLVGVTDECDQPDGAPITIVSRCVLASDLTAA